MMSSKMDHTVAAQPVSCLNMKEHAKFYLWTKFDAFFTYQTILDLFCYNLLDYRASLHMFYVILES